MKASDQFFYMMFLSEAEMLERTVLKGAAAGALLVAGMFMGMRFNDDTTEIRASPQLTLPLLSAAYELAKAAKI